jgi:PAS domain S-box-containing protein
MAPEDNGFLRRVLDSVTDPLVIYNRELRIVRVNRAIKTLFRISAEDLNGRHCYELFYNREKRCEECHVYEVFQTGEPRMREKEIHLPDGGSRYFEVHSYPIRSPRGEIVEAIEHVRDITERKELERQLRESEEKYRTIVEMAREGIYTLDHEARVVFANRRLAEMLGYRLDEIIGRPMFELMDEEAKAIAAAQLDRRRKGLTDIYELKLVKKDGGCVLGLISVAPLMVNDAFSGSLGILTDITPLKETEAKLRSAKLFHDKIINSITDNLAIIDPKTYRIVEANDSFLARVGRSSLSDLTQEQCYKVILGRNTPCEADGIHCPVQEAVRMRRSSIGERVYPDSRGQARSLQVAAYPLLDSRGNVELVIRLERDVTEKRRMEEALTFRSRELQKTQHQLEVLCEISRQVSNKVSVRELIHLIYDIALKVFPGADPLFLVFNARCNFFLSLKECESNIVEPLRLLLQTIEQSGMASEFYHFLANVKEPQIITDADNEPISRFLRPLTGGYSAWFGLPMITQQQCVGCFLLGSKSTQEFSREDLQFFQALFDQVSGHLRHFVLYEAEINQLRKQVTERASYGGIIGQSKKMQEIYELIDLVSGSDATVLITGENGTGKELVAQAIHKQSHRSKGPFIVANCSAYSPTLLESELFGHEKGAFTGAINQKKGRIERAQGGTLFMDEIGDIAPATQILLLRFLQDHRFERVGGERTIEADVRVLAATNRDLLREAQGGRFRDDLYYRLNVIAIHLPPLRERKEDIPLLAQHFLKKYNLKEGKKVHKFSSNAMQVLMDYEWPGNVRQLENAISHAIILCQGDVIKRRHLPRFLREMSKDDASTSLSENERSLILRVLMESNWNKHDAARRLRVSRSTLYSKIRRYGIEQGAPAV